MTCFILTSKIALDNSRNRIEQKENRMCGVLREDRTEKEP